MAVLQEAVLCVRELESPKSLYMFVNVAVTEVLERSQLARTMTGDLLNELVKQEVLSLDQYIQG